MDPFLIGGLAIIALLLLLMVRVPIGFALFLVSFCGLWFLRGFDIAWNQLGTIPQEFAANWTLSAIPMFILMGAFAQYSGITTRLFDAAKVWLGRLPGGLAVATSVAAAGFAAASGSSLAMAAAMSKIAVPEMLKAGYQPALATATVAAAGTIGSMIPPSILFILFGWYTETPVTKLFIAGILPGLLTAGMYGLMIWIRCTINPSLAPPLPTRFSMAEKWSATFKMWPALLLILAVIFGIYSGLTSATESGAFGAFGALVIALLMGRMTFASFRDSLLETVKSVSLILFIAIGAVMLTRFMALSGLPEVAGQFIAQDETNVAYIIFFMAVVYIILGMFLDPIGIILITLPIMMPMFKAADMNMVWVGVMVVKLIEIGLITPPVGLNAFVVRSSLGNTVKLGEIFRGLNWFIGLELLVFLLLAAFPGISLFLPNQME